MTQEYLSFFWWVIKLHISVNHSDATDSIINYLQGGVEEELFFGPTKK